MPQQTAAPDAAALPVIDFISSSATLDRYDEIIRPEGWQLDNYRRNPVFQNAHQYGDIIFTLGKALITEVRATPRAHLFQRIEFAVDVNPMARIAYGLYQHRFLNAVSVGFIPLRWQNEDGSEHSGISNFKSEISEGLFQRSSEGPSPRRIYLEQELLEVSAVGIPANPEALQLGLKAGVVQKTDLKELLDLLTESVATGVSPAVERGILPRGSGGGPSPGEPGFGHAAGAPPSLSGATPGATAQLLGFARTLRDLLRHT